MAVNKGVSTTALDGDDVDHIITDFAETVEAYPDTAFEWKPYVQTFTMVGRPGNTREIIYTNQTDGLAKELAEGETPEIIHGEFKSQTISTKKYGVKIGVSREMLEDSRLDEMQAAMEKALNMMLNRYTERFFDQLKTGPYGSTDVPEPYRNKSWAAASNHSYSADHDGTLVAQSADGHIYNTGSATLYLGDINLAIRHITEHGFSPDTMLISEGLAQVVADMVGFTREMVGASVVQEVATLGRVVGRLQGLDVVVVRGGWVGDTQMIITDRASRPIAFVEKRRLTIEDDTRDKEGFDIVTSSLTARYGFATKTPHKGATVVLTVTA